MILVPLPFQKALMPSSLKILLNAWPMPVYAVADVPADGTAWTWKRSLMRSKGAVAVRAMAPAAPPATNIL